MTTVLADARLGMMVADSHCTDGDRVWKVRKVHRLRGALIGLAGDVAQGAEFLEWWKAGALTPPVFAFDESSALLLEDTGLYLFDASTIGLTKVDKGIEAIGTGSGPAMAAYEALGWKDPRRAVRIACNHDNGSRPPVRVYKLHP